MIAEAVCCSWWARGADLAEAEKMRWPTLRAFATTSS